MEQELREEMQKQYDFLIDLSTRIFKNDPLTNECLTDISHDISQQLLRLNAVLNP